MNTRAHMIAAFWAFALVLSRLQRLAVPQVWLLCFLSQ